MADLAELEMRIKSLEAETATRRLDRLYQSSRRAETGADRLDRGFTKAAKATTLLEGSAGRLVRQLGALSAVFGVTLTTGVAVRAIADYESGLVAVGKTANLSGQELRNFGKDIIALRRDLGGVTTERLLELAAAAAQLGVKGKQNILAFTEALARVEVSSDVAGAAGAQALATILNLSRDGVGAVEKASNVLVGLGNDANAFESQILNIAESLAQALSRFKPTSQGVLALATAFKEAGGEAELSSSAIGRFLGEITKAFREGGAKLEGFARLAGATTDELKNLVATDVTTGLFKVFEGLNKLQQSGGPQAVEAALTSLGVVADRDLNRALTPLVATFEKLTKDMRIANEQARITESGQRELGAAYQESEKAFEKFSSRITDIYESLKDLVRTQDSVRESAETTVQTLADAVKILGGADPVQYSRGTQQLAAALRELGDAARAFIIIKLVDTLGRYGVKLKETLPATLKLRTAQAQLIGAVATGRAVLLDSAQAEQQRAKATLDTARAEAEQTKAVIARIEAERGLIPVSAQIATREAAAGKAAAESNIQATRAALARLNAVETALQSESVLLRQHTDLQHRAAVQTQELRAAEIELGIATRTGNEIRQAQLSSEVALRQSTLDSTQAKIRETAAELDRVAAIRAANETAVASGSVRQEQNALTAALEAQTQKLAAAELELGLAERQATAEAEKNAVVQAAIAQQRAALTAQLESQLAAVAAAQARLDAATLKTAAGFGRFGTAAKALGIRNVITALEAAAFAALVFGDDILDALVKGRKEAKGLRGELDSLTDAVFRFNHALEENRTQELQNVIRVLDEVRLKAEKLKDTGRLFTPSQFELPKGIAEDFSRETIQKILKEVGSTGNTRAVAEALGKLFSAPVADRILGTTNVEAIQQRLQEQLNKQKVSLPELDPTELNNGLKQERGILTDFLEFIGRKRDEFKGKLPVTEPFGPPLPPGYEESFKSSADGADQLTTSIDTLVKQLRIEGEAIGGTETQLRAIEDAQKALEAATQDGVAPSEAVAKAFRALALAGYAGAKSEAELEAKIKALGPVAEITARKLAQIAAASLGIIDKTAASEVDKLIQQLKDENAVLDLQNRGLVVEARVREVVNDLRRRGIELLPEETAELEKLITQQKQLRQLGSILDLDPIVRSLEMIHSEADRVAASVKDIVYEGKPLQRVLADVRLPKDIGANGAAKQVEQLSQEILRLKKNLDTLREGRVSQLQVDLARELDLLGKTNSERRKSIELRRLELEVGPLDPAQLERFNQAFDNLDLSEKIQKAADSMSEAIGNFAESAITDASNIGEAFRQLALDISKSFLEAFVIDPLKDQAQAAIGGFLKQATGLGAKQQAQQQQGASGIAGLFGGLGGADQGGGGLVAAAQQLSTSGVSLSAAGALLRSAALALQQAAAAGGITGAGTGLGAAGAAAGSAAGSGADGGIPGGIVNPIIGGILPLAIGGFFGRGGVVGRKGPIRGGDAHIVRRAVRTYARGGVAGRGGDVRVLGQRMVRAYQRGGVLTRPTTFETAGGPVVGGDKGPELFLPAKKRGGDFGITIPTKEVATAFKQAMRDEGGRGGGTTINQNIYTPDPDAFRKSASQRVADTEKKVTSRRRF